jgi:hypothetical protein
MQDSAVVQDPDGDGKIVYLFLPLYKVRFVATPERVPTREYSVATFKTPSTPTS